MPNGRNRIAILKRRFRGYQLHFENEAATQSMLRAIEDFPQFVQPTTERPLIIDCGANIGISMLEWKSRWPTCRVICFEPDPFSFALLELNVERNDIPGVACIQAAIAACDGTAILHGELGRGADGRGNSISEGWGRRRQTDTLEVPCKSLSNAVPAEPIDFLKLDIEGVEESVIRSSPDVMRRVAAAYIEVHETRDGLGENSLARIEKLLSDLGFSTETETRHSPHALPPSLASWQRQVGARQSHILCWRDP